MPNTLAHAGVQSVVTRFGYRAADLKLIYLACIIPDVPWILQRIARFVVPGVDPFTLRAYVIVQASILCCLFLCAAVAVVARSPWTTFGLLAANSVLHLLLDALQTKWANGVHVLAPFSWELINWGLFWPESMITYVMSGLGLVYIVTYWRRSTFVQVPLRLSATRLAAAGTFIAAYGLLPLLLLQQPVEANNHFLCTLMANSRSGRYVELDRVRYIQTEEGGALDYWGREQIAVEGVDIDPPASVSVRGVFTGNQKIRVTDYHVHPKGVRNAASYIGLILIMTVWVIAWVRDTSSRRSKG